MDVAVLLANGTDDLAFRLELLGDLTAAVGTDAVDLVVLNEAPNELAFRVLRDGRLLVCRDEVCRDERVRVRHRVQTILNHLDLEPLRRIVARGLAHRLAEETFGRP